MTALGPLLDQLRRSISGTPDRVLGEYWNQGLKDMILSQFRKHLAEELTKLPMELTSESGSYAVTTAALARKILDYLNIQDLTIANGFRSDEPSYKLGTVLNRILHFKLFGWDSVSFPMYPKGNHDLVTVYSDKSHRYRDRIYLRWSVYRTLLLELATDDLLIGRYLMRHSITLLTMAGKVPTPQGYFEELRLNQLLRSATDLVVDSWELIRVLSDNGEIALSPLPFPCYEEIDDGNAQSYDRFQNQREFFEGYGNVWTFASFVPQKMTIEGCELYCMLFDEIEKKENGTIRGLAVPFGSLIDLLSDVQSQLLAKEPEGHKTTLLN